MLLTKEMLENKRLNGFCSTIYKAVGKKPREVRDIIKDYEKKKLEINPYEFFAIQEYYKLEDDEINALERIFKITNSEWVVRSHDVADSKIVRDSYAVTNCDTVVDSNNIKDSYTISNSTNVFNSHDIRDSQFVFDSCFVKDSTDVHNSFFVEDGSRNVYNSYYIFDSSQITKCSFIDYCVNMENCFFCKLCEDDKNCLFCYSFSELQDENKYYFFNKEITKEKFDAYLKTMNNFIIFEDVLIHDLSNWLKTLPEYDEILFNGIKEKAPWL